jgi:hypothetical protein
MVFAGPPPPQQLGKNPSRQSLPTKVDAEKMRDIAVETTVIAGKVVAGVDPF